MPQHKQLAALAQAEAALHLATVKCRKEPRNNAWRREQAALQETVQALRDRLWGRGEDGDHG
jgi:hypothetical protein